MKYTRVSRHLVQASATLCTVVMVTSIVFVRHGKPLTAGLVDLLIVMLIGFHWGFMEAVVASICAAACLDFFYMAPIFSLYEKDPQDWISSLIFIAMTISAGHFADSIKRRAKDTDQERTRLEKLYLTSRDVLMLNRREGVGSQLARLIVDTFEKATSVLFALRIRPSARGA